ncbi:MAG TPA: hypothetical protein VGD80_18905, partial [Kofleriaceae bacterium]
MSPTQNSAGSPARSSSDDGPCATGPDDARRADRSARADSARPGWSSLADDLHGALDDILGPLRDTAVASARFVHRVGVRIDALSLDLARDLGAVSRDAQA